MARADTIEQLTELRDRQADLDAEEARSAEEKPTGCCSDFLPAALQAYLR